MNQLTLAAVALSLSLIPATHADWKEKVTATGPGSHPMLPNCEMTFNAGWKDVVNAGQVKVTLVNEGDSIKVMGKGANVGAANALLPVEGEFLSLIDASNLLPKAMEQTEKRSGDVMLVEVQFGDQVTTSKTLNAGGEELKFNAQYPVPNSFDLVSAGLFLRSQPLNEVGESYTVPMVVQSSPKLVTVKVVEKGTYDFNGESLEAAKVEVTFEGIQDKALLETAKKNEDATKKKFSGSMTSVFGWISLDDRRLPLEVGVEIQPIGMVSAKLTQYTES